MAARLNPRKKFYTYKLTTNDGLVAYVGKGSGRRLQVQKRNYGLDGEVIAYHQTEEIAYKSEKKFIEQLKPFLNKCAGGNGSKAAKTRKPKKTAFEVLYDKLGSRVLAARLCLCFENMCDPSKVDKIREVAYG